MPVNERPARDFGRACPAGASHDFQSYLVATLPPDAAQLAASDVASWTQSSSARSVIETLTAKRYLVACSKCGMAVGGFVGDAPPDVEVVDEPSVSSESSES